MAREVRIEYPGAVYHVIARGNAGNPVFFEDRDRKQFLKTLGDACEKTGWIAHAYVLMSNHYHLLIETPEPNLVAGMKWLQGTYTRRHHMTYRQHGHLFQGRYRAVVVQADDHQYFSVASTYIHLNPVRAGMIHLGEESLSGYRWSSYPEYLQAADRRPPWLQTERVLQSLGFSADTNDGCRGYEAYLEGRALEWGMAQGRHELDEQWKLLRRGWYLGDNEFRDRLLVQVAQVRRDHQRESYQGGARLAHDENAAETRLYNGLARLRLGLDDVRAMPKASIPKQVLAWWLRRTTTVSRRWIRDRLQMGDESRVTQSVKTVENSENANMKELRDQLEQVAFTGTWMSQSSGSPSTPEFLD
jgi:putative transposase